ncbi:hypothetical protein GCM10027037_24020 [Mucilaginibacter koreensis]
MSKEEVAVIIPIYKKHIDQDETSSLNQCLNVLGRHKIIFIFPQSLDTSFYKKYCENRIKYDDYYFDDVYFKDIAGYNRLMLSAHFYKQFLKYKFILIYQLDSFVFKDELKLWCDKNYDYIGAPQIAHTNGLNEISFLKNYTKLLNLVNKLFGTHFKVKNVGNGGFSLRKTQACYFLVKYLKRQVKNWGENNEDGFFKYWGNLLSPLFKIPDDNDAAHFAIEAEPKKYLSYLNNELPFGCHAYKKYDWPSW